MHPDQFQAASALVASAASVREAANRWRAQHPGLHAMVVDAFDMRGETPALQIGARSLYLVASAGHCWTVTQDAQAATALVFTQEDAA